MCIYIYIKLSSISTSQRKQKATYYLLLITKNPCHNHNHNHPRTNNNNNNIIIISRLDFGANLFLSSHFPPTPCPPPFPEQKNSFTRILLFFTHFQNIQETRQKTTKKKRINEETVSLLQPPRSFPSLTPSEQSKSQYVVIIVMIKRGGGIYSLREWEGLRRYSSLECRKKPENEGSEKKKTVWKNRIEGKRNEE